MNFANLIINEVNRKKSDVAAVILSGQCNPDGYRYNTGVHNTLEDITPLVKECLKKILKQEGMIDEPDSK